MSPDAFIHGMPKCELHVHLEGTLEADMKFRLAERNGVQLPYPDVAALEAAYVFDDLASFLRLYYEGMSVLRTEQDFYDLCFAYLHKVRSQNVLYVEMSFDPQAHTSRGISFDSVIHGLRRAQMDAERTLGIQSQLVMCFLRERSEEEAMQTLRESLAYRDWIVGVGLDSYEPDNPPLKFQRVFLRARQEGYLLTMHCDVNQPNTHEHLRQAMAEIGVDRIDHGVNVLDDPALIEMARDRQIAFTLCPFANQVVMGPRQAHEPVRRLLDLGLRVTLNSDDPAYMQGFYLEENFRLVQQALGLDLPALLTLSRNSFEVSWLSRTAKDRHLTQLNDFARKAMAPE